MTQGAAEFLSLVLVGLACACRAPVTSPASSVFAVDRDVARAALTVQLDLLSHVQVRRYIHALDAEATAIQSAMPGAASATQTLGGLNEDFFGSHGFTAITDLSRPESVSLAAVLDTRRGTCVGLAIVYLALAQRLGLDAHGVATPDHLYIRVKLGDRVRNVELLDAGREIEDDTYRRRHRIDPGSIEAGVFLRDLTNGEVVAHLLSNQAVALSKQGKLEEALARYDAALELAPQLVAASYNRGLDLMNAGRLQEALASFDKAIELHPADAQGHNNRGLARLKLGDVEGARSDWRRALELQPGMREAKENLERLLAPRE